MTNIEKWHEINRKMCEALEKDDVAEHDRLEKQIEELERDFTRADWQYMLENAGCSQAKIFYKKKIDSIDK